MDDECTPNACAKCGAEMIDRGSMSLDIAPPIISTRFECLNCGHECWISYQEPLDSWLSQFEMGAPQP